MSDHEQHDCLTEIAKWTVECSYLDCKGTGYITKYGGEDGTVPSEALCPRCLNTGGVLDPRFTAIRHLYHVHLADGQPCYCGESGYTVNRDLSVLLACVLSPNLEAGFCVEDGEVACEFETWVPEFTEGGEHVRKVVGQGSGPTPLEAAAQAAHEFLEASIPVEGGVTW